MSLFRRKKENEKPVLAAVIRNPVISGIYEDLLRTNQIPYLIRQEGAGGYVKILLGGGIVPDCFYVAPGDLAKARELYTAYLDTEIKEPENEE